MWWWLVVSGVAGVAGEREESFRIFPSSEECEDRCIQTCEKLEAEEFKCGLLNWEVIVITVATALAIAMLLAFIAIWALNRLSKRRRAGKAGLVDDRASESITIQVPANTASANTTTTKTSNKTSNKTSKPTSTKPSSSGSNPTTTNPTTATPTPLQHRPTPLHRLTRNRGPRTDPTPRSPKHRPRNADTTDDRTPKPNSPRHHRSRLASMDGSSATPASAMTQAPEERNKSSPETTGTSNPSSTTTNRTTEPQTPIDHPASLAV